MMKLVLPKIIAADIDGTLVEHGQEFSEYSRDVIECLRSHGVLFGLASGRPFEHMYGHAEKWGFHSEFDFFIGMNGAELLDLSTDEVYRFNMLEPDDIQKIVTIMHNYKCNCCVYEGADMYVQRIDDEVTASAVRNKTINYVVEDEFYYSKERAKLMFRFHDLEEIARAEKYFEEHPSDTYWCFRTQPCLLEFADKNTDKANALKKYCELHGCTLNYVCAAGDNSNDNGMISASGWGVCLLNGSEDTKMVADAITEYDCWHDGFAHYLEDTFIIPNDLKKGEEHV